MDSAIGTAVSTEDESGSQGETNTMRARARQFHLSPPTCIASSILMAHAQQFSIDLHLPGRPY